MPAIEGTLLAARYRIVRRLGSGAMAVVFLAQDERLGRPVAIKRLHADSPEETAERFEREARLGASLNHPNIVAVYDVAHDLDGVLIVMEYVNGWTLARATAGQRLDPGRALEILAGVAAALDHAHRHGVIHRDVKPANVLLRTDGVVKLADLGIATAATATRITHAGSVLGTPSYMAPEQLEGGDVTAPVDVYALAALAFELLSGKKARDGRSPMEIAHTVASQHPPDLSVAWPEAPPRLGRVLARGMAREPAQRPRSASELVRGLGDLTARPPQAPRRRAWAAGGEAERPRSPAPGWVSGAAATAAGARERRRAPVVSPRPADSPAGGARRPGRRGIVAALGALLLGATATVVALSGARPAESPRGPSTGANAPATTTTAEPRPAGEQRTTTATRDAGSEARPSAGGSPERAVRSFYERAARDDFEGAWALAGPGFRSQLRGFESFRGTVSTLESIRFERAETVSGRAGATTVAIETLATHPDRVDRCSGTVSLEGEGDEWRIERAAVTCAADRG